MSTTRTIQHPPPFSPAQQPTSGRFVPPALSGASDRPESGNDDEQRRIVRTEVRARFARLSRRERDVFLCLMAGRTNRATAAELGLSDKTVEEYRAKVMAKMQARSLPDLVKMAVLADEIDPYVFAAGPR